jgi:hypothetical protein
MFSDRIILSSWNKFLRFVLHFVVLRCDHNEWLVRINLPLKPISIGFELGRLKLVFLLLRWQKEDTRKMFNFFYRNIVRRSLSTCSKHVSEFSPVWSSL